MCLSVQGGGGSTPSLFHNTSISHMTSSYNTSTGPMSFRGVPHLYPTLLPLLPGPFQGGTPTMTGWSTSPTPSRRGWGPPQSHPGEDGVPSPHPQQDRMWYPPRIRDKTGWATVMDRAYSSFSFWVLIITGDMEYYNGTSTTNFPATTVEPGVLTVDPGAWGVAVALTVLVIMTLCLVVLYTKARRRRTAERGRRHSIRALSGGVPMG